MSDLAQHLSYSRMSGIPVRVSVEIGRGSYPLGEAVSFEPGQVISLDKEAQAPAEVYVDGMLYARGQLSSAGGRWAVKLEEVLVDSKPDFLTLPEPSEEILVEDTAELEQ